MMVYYSFEKEMKMKKAILFFAVFAVLAGSAVVFACPGQTGKQCKTNFHAKNVHAPSAAQTISK